MSEIMRPIPFPTLVTLALETYAKNGSIFGIRKDKFYRNNSGNRIDLFGVALDAPVGPAAGPNTQLAQNIAAAFLSGSRFIELKTVQTLDGAEMRDCIARPCINGTDECYNVEWSTELTVQEAFEEYVKAWFLVHVFGIEFGLGTGVCFNMSVGYSYEGISAPKIDAFIEGLKNAADTEIFKSCKAWLRDNLSLFNVFTEADMERVPAAVSTSITLSTLHGCPSAEIEKIAHYLLTEKQIHTYVKCNPTLLGYETARRIMDGMGYDYVSFDEHHFKEDLQFSDAVSMLCRLKETAAGCGLTFGAKLTNTFPVDIKRGELPGEEMYMSGRALFPLTVTVAAKIADAFSGELPISYSGGVDRFNIEDILATGIRPVTMATSILKPGGYERLHQIAELAEACVDSEKNAIDTAAVARLRDSLEGRTRHKKQYRQTDARKGDMPLPLTDCAVAPCSVSGCPINQQIPAYLEQVAKGDLVRAFEIIANDNVLPSVTGTICDHQCQNRCTRINYDDPLQIRGAKKASSVAAQADFTARIKPTPLKSDKKILVIGAGPAGIAAAAYLRRNGIAVDVRETREHSFGIVSSVIPAFRVSDEAIALDQKMTEAFGVNFIYGAPADYDLSALKKAYDYIILATGAWLDGKGSIRADGDHILDALKFLEESRRTGLQVPLGGRVAVIGAGDVAMDCARAAARNIGNPETVIVYRRTRAFMPAQPEEISAAEADGVKIVECRSPLAFEDGLLVCEEMTLGDFDSSGRRSVTPSGMRESLPFDTIINAVGAGVDTSLFTKNSVKLDDRGFVSIDKMNETSLPGVYVAGDCKAGPATVVKAMADAKKIAADILSREGIEADFVTYQVAVCRDELIERKGILKAMNASQDGAGTDAVRCLACGNVCEICVDVCPNRANIALDTGDAFAQRYQVVHVDRICNECGNCGVFCPSSGDPYKNKFTVFATSEDFETSENIGFIKVSADAYRVRLRDGSVATYAPNGRDIPADYAVLIEKIGVEYASLL